VGVVSYLSIGTAHIVSSYSAILFPRRGQVVSCRVVCPIASSLTRNILSIFQHRTNKMSIESDSKTFYYMTRESLCFLAMTESKYPKRMAFLYLDEVCDLVLQELIRDHGNNVSSNRKRLTSAM